MGVPTTSVTHKDSSGTVGVVLLGTIVVSIGTKVPGIAQTWTEDTVLVPPPSGGVEVEAHVRYAHNIRICDLS